MGFINFLKSKINSVTKNSRTDSKQAIQNKRWHCGVCGMELDSSDWICPACGGTPVDQNGKVK